jgi:hypothetical protein
LFLVFDATEMADLVIGCRLMGLDPETIWVQLGLSAGAFCILSDDAAATSEQATTIKAGLRQISAALLRFYQGIPAVPAAEKAAVEANVKVTANYLLSIQGAVWFMTYTSGAGGFLTLDFGGDCVSTPKPKVQPNIR